ncbi:MAG: Methyltransferase domain [Erythrobacteraceae bacterium HL-111]|nr:MAG: Methyltransferase domain [Erythrobacteraceae bacterium HL-111]
MTRVTVDQFYGIEYEEFPAMIAEVAMWMADHIANNEINEAFRLNYARIPLTGGATIRHGDALEVDWNEVLPAQECSFVMGNPPFVGSKYQSAEQRAQVRRIADLGGSGGTLDYVAAWFLKAGAYLNGTSSPLPVGEGLASNTPLPNPSPSGEGLSRGNRRIRIAFVSTNSITQGEQVAQLWPLLFDRYGLEIAFAHRTFNWFSEARGKAHVHVVIIGLTHRDFERPEKRLFSYPDIKGDPVESRHGALTAYLFDATRIGPHTIVQPALNPLDQVSKIVNGSVAADGGNLVFGNAERAEYLSKEPDLKDWIKPFVGGEDLLNATQRHCFWLVDCPPSVMRGSQVLRDAIKSVKEMRLASKKAATRQKAESAYLFAERRQPKSGQYLALPRTSSERREFLPIEVLPSDIIAANDLQIIPNASLFEFAVLTTTMHMAWIKITAGRLESRYRYSAKYTYNTFPWPEATEAQRGAIENLAQGVLDARAAHPTSSLADLYDPDTMPANLRKAHRALDSAVDRLYRRRPFESDRDRVEHLFGLYEELVNPMAGAEKANRRTQRRSERRGARRAEA